MPEDWVERHVKEALISVSCGLDIDKINKIQASMIIALQKKADALKDATYDPKDYDAIAKAAAHAAKTLDLLTRLSQFAKGEPDSRPDLGREWLQALTDEQLEQVQAWLKEAQEQADGAGDQDDATDAAGSTPERRERTL